MDCRVTSPFELRPENDEAGMPMPTVNVGDWARAFEAVVIPGPAGKRSEAEGDPVHGLPVD